jgi:hypothetical protein
MLHNSSVSKLFSIFSFSLLIIFATGCAEVHLDTIPAPPPTAKLRVLVIPVSGLREEGKRGWKETHEEWARKQVWAIQEFLGKMGAYEMPTGEELDSVTGERTFSILDWSRKDWSLVRQAGQALYADYAMIMQRGLSKGFHEFETVLINIETGKRFKVLLFTRQYRHDRWTTMEYSDPINRLAYNKIFREAKNDMLATAIRKGRLASLQFFEIIPVQPAVPPVPRLEEKSSVPPEVIEKAD